MQITGNKLYLERYLIAYGSIFLISLALVISKLKSRYGIILGLLYTITCIYLLTFTYQYKVNQNKGYRELAELVSGKAYKNTRVIVDNPIDYTIARYYFGLHNMDKNLLIKTNDPYIADWEIVDKDKILVDYTPLKDLSRIFVYTNSTEPGIWYIDSRKVANLYIYSTLKLPTALVEKTK